MKSGAEEEQARLASLISAIGLEGNHCLEMLDRYVAAQLSGQDYRALYPEVAAHLDSCLDCASAYNRVYELECDAAANRLPEANPFPRPNLSFLRQGTSAPTLAERLIAGIIRSGDRLTLQLTPDLLMLLRPQASPLAMRAPNDGGRYSEVLLSLSPLELPDPLTPISLEAYRDGLNPEQCLIEIRVEPPGRAWPDLGGMRVNLQSGEDRREATTDAWGQVSFDGIPVDHLFASTLYIDVSSTV